MVHFRLGEVYLSPDHRDEAKAVYHFARVTESDHFLVNKAKERLGLLGSARTSDATEGEVLKLEAVSILPELSTSRPEEPQDEREGMSQKKNENVELPQPTAPASRAERASSSSMNKSMEATMPKQETKEKAPQKAAKASPFSKAKSLLRRAILRRGDKTADQEQAVQKETESTDIPSNNASSPIEGLKLDDDNP
jgi:outer membrane translocation and assembly module TamA